MKVFNNNVMPSNIRIAMFNYTDGRYCNDVFIKWYLEDEMPKRSYFDSDEEYEEEKEWWEEQLADGWTVTQWLLTQGCELGETVLLEHMW